MIIYWILCIGILVQGTVCDDLDIDESVLTAEEEEVSSNCSLENRKMKTIFFSWHTISSFTHLHQHQAQLP